MDNYINIKGVCAITKLKEPTIRKYISCDLIPYIRVGRLIRFRPSQIEAWLLRKERNTVVTGEQSAAEVSGGELFAGLVKSEE
jgi:excisionase family DNA binding protein